MRDTSPSPQPSPAPREREPEFAPLWRALDQLTDPEIPVVTLREMGILRDLRRGADGRVEVVITPTYSGCPAMDQIADDIGAVLKGALTAACAAIAAPTPPAAVRPMVSALASMPNCGIPVTRS